MPSPLEDLTARLEELRSDVNFIALAAQLRPRLGGILQWQGQREILDLARQFMSNRFGRPEGVWGALFIRMIAAFERYLRQVVEHILSCRVASAKTYDDLTSTLASRNLVLTGRLLAGLENPRDHLTIDPVLLIQNLASFMPGSTGFRLNIQAFSATIAGVSPAHLEKALKSVEIDSCWDAIGSFSKLSGLLETKGARATAERAIERLKELSRRRNNLAHGADVEVVISEVELRDAIEFVGVLAAAVDAAVRKKL